MKSWKFPALAPATPPCPFARMAWLKNNVVSPYVTYELGDVVDVKSVMDAKDEAAPVCLGQPLGDDGRPVQLLGRRQNQKTILVCGLWGFTPTPQKTH